MAMLKADINLREWHELDKRQREYLKDWESQRIIGKCKSCGQPYSYEKGSRDPKQCQSCRGEEGELIY